jgi:hypothetical protein
MRRLRTIMRAACVSTAALGFAVLSGTVAGCGPSSDNTVYLRAQLNDQQSSCGDRLSFYRVGGDGSIAGPKDANGNFTIPSGQSLIVTDNSHCLH